MVKKKISQKKEITYNIINSLLAGSLVLFGSFTSGHITLEGFIAALVASGVVAISQFKKYWDSEKKDYCAVQVFSFVR